MCKGVRKREKRLAVIIFGMTVWQALIDWEAGEVEIELLLTILDDPS